MVIKIRIENRTFLLHHYAIIIRIELCVLNCTIQKEKLINCITFLFYWAQIYQNLLLWFANHYFFICIIVSFASVIFIFSSEYSHLHKPAKWIQKDNLIQNFHPCVNINNWKPIEDIYILSFIYFVCKFSYFL